MPSGIYSITHLESGRRYFGSAVNIQRRWSSHRNDLRENKHHCTFLQRTWNKYGENSFEFLILENCPSEQLLEREQWYLDNVRVSWFDFNICDNAGNCLGITRSSEFRAKLSLARTGHKYPKSSEAKKGKQILHNGFTGHHHSEESKAKISLALAGKKLAPEVVEKRLGIKKSNETRRKISEGVKRARASK